MTYLLRGMLIAAVTLSVMGCGSSEPKKPKKVDDKTAVTMTLSEMVTDINRARGKRACAHVESRYRNSEGYRLTAEYMRINAKKKKQSWCEVVIDFKKELPGGLNVAVAASSISIISTSKAVAQGAIRSGDREFPFAVTLTKIDQAWKVTDLKFEKQ